MSSDSTNDPGVFLSVVTPCYNEKDNLPVLYEELKRVCGEIPNLRWEWILVDDHSRDGSFGVFAQWAMDNPNLKAVRFSRNLGSHRALNCGIRLAEGDCTVVLAADMQDPPCTIPELLEKWSQGNQVVWAVRNERHGQGFLDGLLSRTYYLVMRKFGGLEQMPATGADFFLIDKRVMRTLALFQERNTTILGLLCSIGFRQTEILYDKRARLHGKSGWDLGKKLKLVVDSIVSFTFLPIRYMLNLGMVTGGMGFLYATWILFNYASGTPVQGWSSLMIVTLLLGGLQMVMLGILGEYLWRALEETRSRPLFLVEASTDRALEDRLYGGSNQTLSYEASVGFRPNPTEVPACSPKSD